jgi:tRNA (guanosine-2'-O-)-methyltransferase
MPVPDHGLDTATLEGMIGPERLARLAAVLDRRLATPAFVLDEVHDSHNISAVLRTLEGLGLYRVFVVDRSARFFVNPLVTNGADKWLDLRVHRDTEACVADVRAAGYRRILCTSLEAAQDLESLDWSVPTAVVMGNEHAGVTAAMQRLADGFVRIPMAGFSQSLNISVATALFAHTATMALRRMGQPHASLPPEERARAWRDYLWLSLRQRDRIRTTPGGLLAQGEPGDAPGIGADQG